ncbi:MAG: sfcA 2 [Gammaproteobacteria bacterium]|jgi:malate dehydrogenase (oxaloacetate-decarboxylating)|nr:sfcA 2 [Gammaproteobacteria bacterium]
MISPPPKKEFIETSLTDYALIANPTLNKGTAFTLEEREAFNLFGILPTQISTLETQLVRTYKAFRAQATDLDRYVYLRSLQDSNETLFYALTVKYIEEVLPIIYTPTVGLACRHFSHLYRRPRGIFLTPPEQNYMDQILANPRYDHVQAIVVSDGGRILGLGDQGAGGMGIPIGKLALYSACAGIHPKNTLPILLDVGTDNEKLLQDPLYIGYRHPRIHGQAYDDFIDQFVQAIKRRFPNVLLQWEDFAQKNANRLLAKYRDELCTFNDDIQGTAAIATAALLAAVQVTGKPITEQTIAVLGAGSAGCGVSELLVDVMVEAGLDEKTARARFFMVDREGLLVEGMQGLMSFQEKFLQSKAHLAQLQFKTDGKISLEEVVKKAKPTVLIGASAQPGAFTESIVRSMAAHAEQPIIFPLSNPTTCCEAAPEDLLNWTEGRALIGTGTPFPPVQKNGHEFRIDQSNNSYIFPGVGLGAIAAQSSRVTDSMFMVAAKTVASLSPARLNKEANLLPPLTNIREISKLVAFAVAKEARRLGLSALGNASDEALLAHIEANMWEPKYLPYRKKTKKE